jgi:hypothetical protein
MMTNNDPIAKTVKKKHMILTSVLAILHAKTPNAERRQIAQAMVWYLYFFIR